MIAFYLADEIEDECPKMMHLFSVQVVIKARSQNASSYYILITVLQILKDNFTLPNSALCPKQSVWFTNVRTIIQIEIFLYWYMEFIMFSPAL